VIWGDGELLLDVLLLISGLHVVEQEQGERQGLLFPTARYRVIFHGGCVLEAA
jgi:hypothetical protein